MCDRSDRTWYVIIWSFRREISTSNYSVRVQRDLPSGSTAASKTKQRIILYIINATEMNLFAEHHRAYSDGLVPITPATVCIMLNIAIVIIICNDDGKKFIRAELLGNNK